MDFKYYSERQRASEPRDVEEIDDYAWIAIREFIGLVLCNDYFANAFSIVCKPPLRGIHRTNLPLLDSRIRIRIPDLHWERPVTSISTPQTSTIFDLIEFCYGVVEKPTRAVRGRISCKWQHLTFNQEVGRKLFRAEINRIFEHEKIAFELNEEGMITRIGAPIISDAIHYATFHTGDDDLDSMLETARSKFISRDPAERNEALKDLWDAWERLKTLENPSDKKDSTTQLLDHVADGELRQSLEKETRELTDIGNKFQIRHSEVDRVPLTESHHVDYLFHRMFSLVHMLLVATDRGR